MPEFLTLLPPDDARTLLLSHLSLPKIDSESIAVSSSLGRFTASDIIAPHPLPDFPRTTVDGYAVRARDTFGASDSLPAYLTLVGEVPMGDAPAFEIGAGQCALIHTGGMLPKGADAVVMLEYTQTTGLGGSRSTPAEEIEIFKSVADGENLIRIGEDVAQGQLVIPKGTLIRPAEIGGLMALGITSIQAAKKPRVGLLSTGDEVIDPSQTPRYGQVRDINSYTLGALVEKTGGEAIRYGIFSDSFQVLQEAAAKALSECDVIIITAGSSASTRDMTAEVIRTLGEPGVLVHGINTRPGKPTILGVCNGKAVIGLPGNPVSALVNGYLFVVPVIEKLLGALPKPKATVQAKLTVNLPSQAGREDWWPVKLILLGKHQA
ncbi:gephyrin-like molybdotransferase Glp [Candidatus Villigracilis saccharophilus]|uniref:molybdopterin-binding protein n=1 Tax=Candidatus Villigracilis saccharophilus TaxID=3140684 RepID=UPI0031F060FA